MTDDDLAERVELLEQNLEVALSQLRIQREALQTLLGVDAADPIQDLPDAATELVDDLDRLKQYRSPATDGGDQNLAQACREVARAELRRKQDAFGEDVSIEVTELIEEVHRRRGERPDNTTARRAMDTLAEDHDWLETKPGQPGPHTPNSRLVVSR